MIFLWNVVEQFRCCFSDLASLDILCMEEDIITGHKVTRRASDLQNLVPNAEGGTK